MKGLVNEFKDFKNIDIHVIAIQKIKKDTEIVDGNVSFHFISSSCLPRFISAVTIDKYKIIRKIKQLGPDLVHAHATTFGYYAVQSGYPSIVTVHGLMKEEEKPTIQPGLLGMFRRFILCPMENHALSKATKVTVLGENTRQIIKKEYDREAIVIPNGISKHWIAYNTQKEINGRLLFVGGIMPRKRVEHILQVISDIIKNGNPDIDLYIVGPKLNEAYYNTLMEYIFKNDIQGHIHYLGLLTEEELKKEFATCSIFVLSSEEEQYPMVMLEALANGKPVISSDVGNISDIITDDVNGMLYKFADKKELMYKLNELLSNRELRHRLGNQGYVDICEQDWEKISKKYF